MTDQKAGQQAGWGITLALITAICWGALPIAMKQVLRDMAPYTVVWYRFFIAGIGLLTILTARRQLPSPRLFLRKRWLIWLLVATGGAAHILASVGVASGVVIPKASLTAASMTIMGLIGASFGINRDAFRQIFDKTDLLFKGIIANYKERQTARAQEIDISTGKTTEFKEPPVNTIMYDAYPDYPQSETYHRDKVLASAKQALLSMDHTKSVPH